MNNSNTAVETTANNQKINYQFTALPSNFVFLLDNYTYKLLATLIQKESYWKNNNKLPQDGFFFIRLEDINVAMNSNKNELNLTIEALYINGIIDVRSDGWKKGQRKTNHYKINWDKIIELSHVTFQDILDGQMRIEKCKRGTKCTYITKDTVTEASTKVSTEVSTKVSTNCDPTIDNINNIDNKNNIYNINNILEYNNINNILEETTPTSGEVEEYNTNTDFSSIFFENSFEFEKKEERTTPTLYVVKDHFKEYQMPLEELTTYMRKNKIEDFNTVVVAMIKNGKKVENDSYVVTVSPITEVPQPPREAPKQIKDVQLVKVDEYADLSFLTQTPIYN